MTIERVPADPMVLADFQAKSAELADELEAVRTSKKNMQLMEDRYIELKSADVVTGEGEVLSQKNWETEMGHLNRELKRYLERHGAFGKTYLQRRRTTNYLISKLEPDVLMEWIRKGFVTADAALIKRIGDNQDRMDLAEIAIEGESVALMIDRSAEHKEQP